MATPAFSSRRPRCTKPPAIGAGSCGVERAGPGMPSRCPICASGTYSVARSSPPSPGSSASRVPAARRGRVRCAERSPGSRGCHGARLRWEAEATTGHGAVAVVSDGSSRLREGPGRGRGGSARHEARGPELDTRAIPTLSLRGPQPAQLGG